MLDLKHTSLIKGSIGAPRPFLSWNPISPYHNRPFWINPEPRKSEKSLHAKPSRSTKLDTYGLGNPQARLVEGVGATGIKLHRLVIRSGEPHIRASIVFTMPNLGVSRNYNFRCFLGNLVTQNLKNTLLSTLSLTFGDSGALRL